MICRVGLSSTAPVFHIARALSDDVCRLGEHLSATVIIGLDDPYCLRPNDEGPLIAVPLLGGRNPRPVARAVLAQSKAVVCCNEVEAVLARNHAPQSAVILAGLKPAGPLAPESPLDRALVREVLNDYPQLRACLGIEDQPSTDPIASLAMSCLEAVLWVS
jgi:hypothetical protein